MRAATGILLMICCISCSSFDRMHYRHIRKVPAGPVLFEANAEVRAEENPVSQTETYPPDPVLPLLKTGTASPGIIRDTMLRPATEEFIPMDSMMPAKTLLPVPAADPANGKRVDLSLAVALVMITAGLLLLAFAVLALPYTPIPLIAKIIFGLIIGFAAVRFVVTGAAIFVNRFRTSNKYREDQSLHTQDH